MTDHIGDINEMVFTDDELKRLKEYHEGRGYYIPTASEHVSLWALLARLEAAEAYCEYLDDRATHDFGPDGIELRKSWLRAKGEKA